MAAAADDPAHPDGRAFDPVWYGWRRRKSLFRVLQKGVVRVAVELKREQDGPALWKACVQRQARIAPVYVAQLKSGQCRFFTMRIAPAKLPGLASHLARFKLGLIGGAGRDPILPPAPRGRAPGPAPVQVGDLASPQLRMAVAQALREAQQGRRRVEGMAFLRKTPKSALRMVRSRAVVPADTPLMAVIDFGCAFAHPAFQSIQEAGQPARSRVRHFWDQGRHWEQKASDELGLLWPWRPLRKDMAYGREATGESLDRLMQGVAAAAKAHRKDLVAPDFQDACYVASLLPELLEPWSHGTAVLGIAAGSPFAGAPWTMPADAAAQSDIIFVQVPEPALRDYSGGWVTPYVLDALTYIRDRAAGRPVVVNLSMGTHAGSHDGGSLLEAVLDETARTPGMLVVLAAGNAANRKGHAKARIEPGATASIQWVRPPNDTTQSFLEIWFDRAADGAVPVVTVEHPATCPTRCDAAMEAPVELASTMGCVGSLVLLPDTRAGRDAGMALLTLQATRLDDGSAEPAPPGPWTVSVTNRAAHAIVVDVWIERDEPGVSTSEPALASILAPGNGLFVVNDDATFTGQCGGTATVVVGGYLLQENMRPGPTLPESGRGPARAGSRLAVDALAPADRMFAGRTRGLPALANCTYEDKRPVPRGLASDGTAGLRGTSLAAPWVARQLLNTMAGDVSLRTRSAVLAVLREAQAANPSTGPCTSPPVQWL